MASGENAVRGPRGTLTVGRLGERTGKVVKPGVAAAGSEQPPANQAQVSWNDIDSFLILCRRSRMMLHNTRKVFSCCNCVVNP